MITRMIKALWWTFWLLVFLVGTAAGLAMFGPFGLFGFVMVGACLANLGKVFTKGATK